MSRGEDDAPKGLFAKLLQMTEDEDDGDGDGTHEPTQHQDQQQHRDPHHQGHGHGMGEDLKKRRRDGESARDRKVRRRQPKTFAASHAMARDGTG